MSAMNIEEIKKVAIVMAGGLGIKLWPRSTEKTPKQFIHLTGDGTMIQNTVTRLLKFFKPEDIYVVTIDSMKEIVEGQLEDIPKDNIILEPFGRNTAPCLALSYIKLQEKYGPDAIMAAFPSDHVIFNKGEFFQSLETAFRAAAELDSLVTIGIQPTRPESQFGYVQVNKDGMEELGEFYMEGVRCSTTFAEKPDIATAKRFIESGDFLWNSGIFVWRMDTFWNAFEKFMSEDAALFRMLQDKKDDDSFRKNLDLVYRQISSVSVDYGIMEKADNVFVVQASFRWSDVGNWDELYRLQMKDARNNVIEGDVVPIDTSNCLVSSNGKLIGIVGVKDLIVIDSEEALLICKRGQSDDVKQIIDFLRRKQVSKYL